MKNRNDWKAGRAKLRSNKHHNPKLTHPQVRRQLEGYTEWLYENGYVDSDVWSEENPVELYIKKTT